MSFKLFFNDKYNRLEVIFFLTYYVLFSMLSGLEYSLIEKRNVSFEFKDLTEILFYGLKSLVAGFVFYKLLIQRYLFEKKYIKFIIGLLIYLVIYNLYILYGYLLVSKISFLPEHMTANAAKWYNSKALLHFSLIYMFREFLVLSALAYFIRSAKQDRLIDQLGKQQLNAELTYLKAQVQPHFFFNTLNNIYSLTLQQSAKAAPLVAKHADIMRYILYLASEPTITLQKEVDFLRDYIGVEAVKYPERIRIDFEVQGIDQTTIIEPLLLLPFIENTFKHGIKEETDEGFVLVILSLVGRELSLEVSNSKSASSVNNGHSGIGLKNIRKRLELLYPQRHSLIIKDETDTYTVFLTLTLNSK
ncbi:sensor histidine kinase [Pedobacter nyackensis]|uniref:sensor histidine kinase n=1 Tax=Pedobacter nyackensis TaxID=475255 RepID=UPI0029319B7F|nr:histidine kinase [Pedobacter nyackensis]